MALVGKFQTCNPCICLIRNLPGGDEAGEANLLINRPLA
jgi:hypothetical protein